MKKKIITLGLTLMLMLSLVACGRAKVDEANVRVAKIVVQNTDNYLDGNINAKEASDAIKSAYDEIDKDDPDGMDESTFSAYVLLIQLEFSEMSRGESGDLDKIKEYRNEIAKLSGLDKRR